MLRKVYPYNCLSIDCPFSEWLRAVKRAVYTSETSTQLIPKISRLFSDEGNVIITLCVRTAFDLYLQALNLPPGTEIVMSAINIPEMVRIIRKYGYIPVPVDIDIDTLAVTPERVEAAITKKTGLIMIALTYGTRYPLGEISKVAKKYNIPLFEDCAEGYCGRDYTGDPSADITVFSFGPIKTATAFQGAVMIVRRNPKLLSVLRRIHGSYPIQPTKVYLKKLIKYASGLITLNTKTANFTLRPFLAALNIDYKKSVVGLMRGFPPGKGLEVYRFQPCAAMLSFLHRRLSIFNEEQYQRLNKNVQEGTDMLTQGGIVVPGWANKGRTYWLYPIMAENTLKAYKDLNYEGIDAYKGISQLNVVDAPIGSSYTQPKNATEMFEKLVYLPLHKDVPLKDIKAICKKTISLLKPKL